ncbi:MAG: GTPase Era [Alphaproteobacteria bacterium]|nr:GTPase Era [Alphaproteobacteria bacterium]
MVSEGFRCGYVAFIGRPNAGKSTLLNQILGTKLAITSDKPQTTRNRIAGVHTDEKMQAILVDTPGIHEAWTALNQQMVQVAHKVLEEVDVIALVDDMTLLARRVENGEEVIDPTLEAICQAVAASGRPVVFVANKIDVVPHPLVLPVIDAISKRLALHAAIPLSALTGDGVQAFLAEVESALPVGPALYPADEWTQVTERFLVAEIVREKIFHLTKAEIPYSTFVEVIQFDETERETNGIVRINADIIVERPSQKGIVIGKGGEMLKRIGTMARKELQQVLDCRVHLELFVKVERDWTRSKRGLSRVGFDPA